VLVPTDPRSRILEATLACFERDGLARTSMEDAAREAGVSRATVYRYFPGGRDQLVSETITWEVGRFFTRLAAAVADAPDFPTRLEEALLFAHSAIEDHDLLQRVLKTEPGDLLPRLQETVPLVLAVIRDYLVPLLEQERLQPGMDPERAADYLARMVLSFIAAQGAWDLTDRDQVATLVRTELLGGVLAD